MKAFSEQHTRFETFTHGADIGVRGYGPTRQTAFEQTALALTSVVADPTTVVAKQKVEISCQGPADELLLVDWLNSVVYEMATRGMLFSEFKIELRNGRLWGWAFGEPADMQRHLPAVEVKGATLTALKVAKTDDGIWVAQCVLDV